MTARDAPGTALPDLSEFDYELPEEQIAQQALPVRDAAKLLVLDRSAAAATRHAQVRDLPGLLAPGDLLVVNATRVLPARLLGERESGGVAEALVLGPTQGAGRFRALLKISGRLRPGIKLQFSAGSQALALDAEVAELAENGEVVLAFEPGASPYSVGRAPLPPYIRRTRGAEDAGDAVDRTRYQTIFARVPGAIAAPTAGLHFTQRLFDELGRTGIGCAEVVLHVGAGTFRPLREQDLRRGKLHAESFELPEATAAAIDETRERGGRVVAVGTTTTRVLEARATAGGRVRAGSGETQLFLRPGDRFRVIDALLTNFHLPRSSLLLLVAAFAGRKRILEAYSEALAAGYRFYSYGDAMLIL
jgi:S-adenosylmethionine:tRNA ribosyltransferase-isomerase